MNLLKTGNIISKFGIIVMSCVILNACNTQDNAATFSGTLIDVDGKPIAGHIVMMYPVDMSETGSMFYRPMRTIAALPGFITARTKWDGSFAFKENINQGMITIGLLPNKMLDIINNPRKAKTEIRSEYQLISVKIGVMTLYGENGPGSSIVFSLPTEKKIKDVVIVARQNPTLPDRMPRLGKTQLPTELTPQDWIVNPYNGHAYIRIMCAGYDAAKARAQAEGAYLVAINDAEEQKWVSSTFGNELYWIGLHKTDSGQWLWDSKEPLGYTNWGPENRFPEEILTKSEKVGAVMTFVDGEWHAVAPGDLFWDNTIYAILEKSSWKTGTISEDR